MDWINQSCVPMDKFELFEGFIYRIEYDNGKKYIGKKSFRTRRKKNLGKKELAKIIDKRKKTYTIVEKESNWKKYTGSSKIDCGSIKNKVILRLCKTKQDMSYWETYYLMRENVLFVDDFINQNVGGKWFAGKLTGSKKYIK